MQSVMSGWSHRPLPAWLFSPYLRPVPLSLGEVTYTSSLGQRLDASVPVQLGAGESPIMAAFSLCAALMNSDALPMPYSTPEAAGPGMYTVHQQYWRTDLRMSLQASCPEPRGHT
jgi:hypothetical protein